MRDDKQMGKKYKEINIINNPLDQDPTFLVDHMSELRDRYSDQRQDDNNTSIDTNNQKLVKKASATLSYPRKVISGINQSRQYLSRVIHPSINRIVYTTSDGRRKNISNWSSQRDVKPWFGI